MRENNGLELDQEEVEPTIGRNFKSKFEILNEYSENILITDSDFILSDRTRAICISGYEFQHQIGSRFQEIVPKRGISVQAETRTRRSGGTSSFSYTGS